ncbi:ovostatin-like isoform X2 [Stegodyphus dumicola]|uniref:ovostatin-like isoform X2 n=1 Tax=Stegodyphus dumicola TaxID=202533 RepID=UPI0015A81AD6|nr:ovostatin-like isoform X2 [Stegodyphus dumicola]
MEKLLSSVIILCMFLSAYAAESSETGNGYIFTCPKSIKTGTTNEMQLRRYGALDAGNLNLKLIYPDSYNSNFTVFVEKDYEIKEGEEYSTLELFVPLSETPIYDARVVLNGTLGDSYTIVGSDTVYFDTAKDNIIIIQTDKPIYKEGQTVKFRVLKVDRNLKPSGKDEANIWVEDPKGTRLFQWKKVPLGSGIKQLEFPLADEPVEGNWKIKASINDEVETAIFEVKEYVLPKYEVDISFPSFVLANAELIPLKICAKYTYGKLVKGDLKLNISLELYAWSREKVPILEIEEKLDGCFEYELNVSLIETGDVYRYRRIMVVASVTEKGTGVERNETKFIQRQYSPLNLNFNRDQRQYYKPGLPYNGKLQVNNPDESPAANEPIELCATVSRQRVLSGWWATKKVKYCKNYTSDDNGVILYTLPPQNTDSIGITIEAKSIRFAKPANPTGTHRENVLNTPETSMSLTPWFSPSGNFLQLQPEQDVLKCGTKKSVTILFTSKEDANLNFVYQVVSQGKVLRSGSVPVSFSVQDDVSKEFQDESKLINEQETQLEPALTSADSSSSSSSSSSEEDCPSAREARYVPPVGKVTIDIDIDASLSPSFHLLVYYIRDDRETVADSQKYKVEKCFKNEVHFGFGDEVQQPGTRTSIKVKAAPNSLCGIKVVDKSVSLLDSSEQLTTEKIFSILESREYVHYGSNPCNEPAPQPGLYKSAPLDYSSIVMPRPWSSSSYEDALAAFYNAGFVVISNLTLFTRPCKSNNRGGIHVQYETQGFSTFGAGGQAVALASTARRPAAPAVADSKMGIEVTKSVVDVRNYFPETWLFEMEMTGPDGEYLDKQKLPHTITEWIGNAVCINEEEGLGISNTKSIKAFQAFFLSFTLPYSVIRGEKFWITISVFNYVQDALPVTVSLDKSDDYVVISDSVDGDVCVQPGDSENLRLQLKATTLGTLNITVRAQTAESSDICGSSSVSDAVAKDGVTNSLIVQAEGWPVVDVVTSLFCPKDGEDGVFVESYDLNLPENVVPDSARGYLDVTGNFMGPSMDNLENLVVLPTGCGEQNMVKFTPNLVVLDYLSGIGELNDKIKNRAIRNLNLGAQREMQYRHADGSFSAFGYRDKEGSMFLTAFVLRSFAQATKYITIDDNVIKQMQTWIISKQQADGCFPDVGRIFDSGLQGGVEKEKSQGIITAYVLASLIISGYKNESIINPAVSCIEEDDSKLSPYAGFLYTYAETLAGKTEEARKRISRLRERANVTDGVEYYPNVNGSQSINLETAAYAVLAILKSGGNAADALPIVRYMTQNLNLRGGFVSTQDTCVGLEALSEIAKLIFKDTLDITLTVTGGLEKTIKLTEEDKLVVKRNRISEVPSEVKVEATGSGCALIQKTLLYNTKTPPTKNLFYLEVVGNCLDGDCKQGEITVIVSYIPAGESSGMSLVEVKMISGMVPVKESLDKLLRDEDLKLMRYGIENDVVVFYYSEISNTGKRFVFQVEEAVKVDDRHPGTAKVYDYYAKEKSASTSYSLGNCESESCSEES